MPLSDSGWFYHKNCQMVSVRHLIWFVFATGKVWSHELGFVLPLSKAEKKGVKVRKDAERQDLLRTKYYSRVIIYLKLRKMR